MAGFFRFGLFAAGDEAVMVIGILSSIVMG
jgi:hypothetical protein